jgi:hypothetical protein
VDIVEMTVGEDLGRVDETVGFGGGSGCCCHGCHVYVLCFCESKKNEKKSKLIFRSPITAH